MILQLLAKVSPGGIHYSITDILQLAINGHFKKEKHVQYVVWE